MDKTSPLTALKGVGDKTSQLFARLNVRTVEELLHYYPRDYDVFTAPVPVKALQAGECAAVSAVVAHISPIKRVRSLQILSVTAKDEEGEPLELTWFNMSFLQHTLKRGSHFIFRGIPQTKNGRFLMEQPKLYTPVEYGELLHTMQPVYGLTAGLTGKKLTGAVRQALAYIDLCEEYMPSHILQENGLIFLPQALAQIHFPETREDLRAARTRLVFDEFFLFIMALRAMRERNETQPNHWPMAETPQTDALLSTLPYGLTDAQKRAWEDIRRDLQGPRLMNRLVQGDVGSGKTIVALLALVMTAAGGRQGAMMVPTEVLARQQYASICGLLQDCAPDMEAALLTGSMTAKQKREAYARIASGQAKIIVGTHALIQEKVAYRELALVVTDEQHRFGVKQREALAGKGRSPHVLVMSATPIPRTLAIILYGDLDISVIDELPAERLPIKNCVVDKSYRPKAYQFIKKEVAAGRQAYIICPMVEESEAVEAENVVEYAAMLKRELPAAICVEYLHGKMKAEEKNRIMEEFAAGRIHVLVSTTVIEVGVNVPNATVMMVENAERFGLAQLHQLRGRVGRGAHQSYCIFMNGTENKEQNKRLEILNKSNDGFIIAEEDLKLRGPGDLFGIRQCGILDFKIADVFNDSMVLQKAGEACGRLMEKEGWQEEPDSRALAERLARYVRAEDQIPL